MGSTGFRVAVYEVPAGQMGFSREDANGANCVCELTDTSSVLLQECLIHKAKTSRTGICAVMESSLAAPLAYVRFNCCRLSTVSLAPFFGDLDSSISCYIKSSTLPERHMFSLIAWTAGPLPWRACCRYRFRESIH